MGDLFAYLDWRGDLTLEADPFNEVDNLLLSELSYTDFEGVFDEDREYSLRETVERYFAIHTEEEVQARTSFIGHAPLLMKPMAQSERFRNLTVSSYVNVVDEEREEQFAAMIFRIREGERPPLIYVAYRGTDDNLVGWKEDFNFSFLRETPSQKRAVEYLEEHFAGKQEQIYVGGHSKGGNLAVYASSFCSHEIREGILRVYSNDGPGFREEVVESEGYREILPKVSSFVPEMGVIGMLLNNSLSHEVIRSSQTGIMQHDALSWQILGNKFVRVEERSEASQFLDSTVRGWLSGLNDEEREQFVDLLFSLFGASGEKTLEGLQKSGLRSANDIVKAMRSLPADERKKFNGILWKLVDSGRQTLFGDLKADLEMRIGGLGREQAAAETGAQETSAQETGTQEAGAQETGAQEATAQETGTQEAEAQEAGHV